MSWVSGSPTVPPREPGSGRAEDVAAERRVPPLAWVPGTSGLAREDDRRVRLDGLALLLSGVAYLLLSVLLIVAGRAETLAAPDRSLPSYFEALRDLTITLGWLGFTASGLTLFVVPAAFGIPYRPSWAARVHLVLANAGLIGFVVASLAGAADSWASAFVLLVAVSYVIFAIPLALALILALEDWIVGEG